MQAVNLLPAYARPGSRWASAGKQLAPRRVFAASGVTAAVVAVALGGLYVHERSAVSHKRSVLADVQSRLAAAEKSAAPLRAAASQNVSRISFVSSVTGSRVPWETVMGQLARILPSQVYLQSMQVDSGAASVPAPTAPTGTTTVTPSLPSAPATPSGTFTVTGTAASQVIVASVLDQLARLPWLSDVQLSSSNSAGGTGAGSPGGDLFNITAEFVYSGKGGSK